MFKYVEEGGPTNLDFVELRELRDQYAKFISNPNSYYHRKKLVGTIHSFLDWYLKYSDDIIKGKNYAPEKIGTDLLRDKRSNKFKCILDEEFGTVLHRTIDTTKAALLNKMEDMKEKGTW